MQDMVMGRPKRLPARIESILVRLPGDIADDLTAWVEEIRRAHLGSGGATRTDLVRDIIVRAVEDRRRARVAPEADRANVVEAFERKYEAARERVAELDEPLKARKR